jgi:hypothetical protein
MLLFLNYKIRMNIKLILSSLGGLLLAACTINPSQITPSLLHSPTAIIDKRLPSAFTALPSLTPTLTPSPTPIPEVHLESGEHAFFNGDYSRAQTEFQQALTNATDLETRVAALWGLGRVEYVSGDNNKAYGLKGSDR